jgi:hypothetical protein
MQDNVENICANHPLLEELDLPQAYLRDKQAMLLLASIKPMKMLRLLTLTENDISEPVLSALGDELPHVLVVFDDMGEMDEVISLDGEGLEEGEAEADGGDEEGEAQDGGDEDEEGEDSPTDESEEDSDSDSDDEDTCSDSDSGTEVEVSEDDDDEEEEE